MKINVDEMLIVGEAKLKIARPWDLTIELGGQAYVTRELADADIEKLHRLSALGDAAPASEQDAFVASLFVGASPDSKSLSRKTNTLLVSAIMTYWADRQKHLVRLGFEYAMQETERQQAVLNKSSGSESVGA